MRQSLLTLAIASVLLGGCSLIPDYQRPEAPVDAPGPRARPTPPTARPRPRWPRPTSAGASSSGPGAATPGGDRPGQQPRPARGRVEHRRLPRAVPHPALRAVPQRLGRRQRHRQRLPADLSSSGRATTSGQYSATVGVSAWEIDFFGRLRSLNEQTLEQYFASEEARRSTQISLVASVANAYLTLQADQSLLKLTRDTLKTYQESLALTQRSFDVGVADALALSQARTAVESAQVTLAQYSRLVAQDRNALALLLGNGVPGDLPQGEVLGDDQLAEVPAGLPSELLQRRPDVLQAEHQLKAANASIGAARAAFFPSISLTANAGTKSAELSGLFDGVPAAGCSSRRSTCRSSLPAASRPTSTTPRCRRTSRWRSTKSHPDRLPGSRRRPRRPHHLRGAAHRPAQPGTHLRGLLPPGRAPLPHRRGQLPDPARCPAPAVQRTPATDQRPPQPAHQRGQPVQGPRRWLERAHHQRPGGTDHPAILIRVSRPMDWATLAARGPHRT